MLMTAIGCAGHLSLLHEPRPHSQHVNEVCCSILLKLEPKVAEGLNPTMDHY